MSELKVTPFAFGGNTGDAVYAYVQEKTGLTEGQKLEIERRVNSHDRLVEESQRLTEMATKHAMRCDELYEALELTNKELYLLINELNKLKTKDVRCDQLDPPDLHDMETCHLNAVLLGKSRIKEEKK